MGRSPRGSTERVTRWIVHARNVLVPGSCVSTSTVLPTGNDRVPAARKPGPEHRHHHRFGASPCHGWIDPQTNCRNGVQFCIIASFHSVSSGAVCPFDTPFRREHLQRLQDVEKWYNHPTHNPDDIRYMVDLHNRDKSMRAELLASIHNANAHRVQVQQLTTILKNGIMMALFICVVDSQTLVRFKSTTVAHFHKKFMEKYFSVQKYVSILIANFIPQLHDISEAHATILGYLNSMITYLNGVFTATEMRDVNAAIVAYDGQIITLNTQITVTKAVGNEFLKNVALLYTEIGITKAAALAAITTIRTIHAHHERSGTMINGAAMNGWDESMVKIHDVVQPADMGTRNLIIQFLNLLHSSAEQLEGHMGLTRTTDIEIVEDNLNQTIEDVIATVDRGNTKKPVASHSGIGESLYACIRRKPHIVNNGELVARVGRWLSDRRYGESEFIAEEVDTKRRRTGQFVSVDSQLPMNMR
jgi:hypothetical protein